MKNSAGRGECYPPRPKAEVDNTLRDLQNSSYPTKAEFNNYSFKILSSLKLVDSSRPFLSLLNDRALSPGFLGQWFNNLWRQWFNNLQRAALLTSFWRQWFNNLQRTALLTSLAQYDRILGQQQLFLVNYACGFNQSETGKYFEWIIIWFKRNQWDHFSVNPKIMPESFRKSIAMCKDLSQRTTDIQNATMKSHL